MKCNKNSENRKVNAPVRGLEEQHQIVANELEILLLANELEVLRRVGEVLKDN